MKASNLVSLALLLGATTAQAAESDLYPVNTTYRDYAKRDRILLGGLDYVSPSQLHENEGLRARIGSGVQNSQLKKNGVSGDLQTPFVEGDVAYGWTAWTLGVRGQYEKASIDQAGDSPAKEKFEADRVTPELAYDIGKYFTIGAGAEISRLRVTEVNLNNNNFTYNYTRAVAGISYHEPAFEFGATYSSEVQRKAGIDVGTPRTEVGTGLSLTDVPQGISRAPGASLTAFQAANERAIYLPATGAIFARGNLTDNFSLASHVSMAKYDGNNEGAVHLFDNYKGADRTAANIVATYWTDNRSRFSLAAEYKGAASTEMGEEEQTLGYRLVNLYGGSGEATLAINRTAYLGLQYEFLRGERNDTDTQTGLRYTGREQTNKWTGFATVKF